MAEKKPEVAFDPSATLAGGVDVREALKGHEWRDDNESATTDPDGAQPQDDDAATDPPARLPPANYQRRHWDEDSGKWVIEGGPVVPDPSSTMPEGLDVAARMARDSKDVFAFQDGEPHSVTDVPISRLEPLPPSGAGERALIYGLLVVGSLFVAAAWYALLF